MKIRKTLLGLGALVSILSFTQAVRSEIFTPDSPASITLQEQYNKAQSQNLIKDAVYRGVVVAEANVVLRSVPNGIEITETNQPSTQLRYTVVLDHLSDPTNAKSAIQFIQSGPAVPVGAPVFLNVRSEGQCVGMHEDHTQGQATPSIANSEPISEFQNGATGYPVTDNSDVAIPNAPMVGNAPDISEYAPYPATYQYNDVVFVEHYHQRHQRDRWEHFRQSNVRSESQSHGSSGHSERQHTTKRLYTDQYGFDHIR